MEPNECGERNSRFQYVEYLCGDGRARVQFVRRTLNRDMALRDIFKFRELPETETSKPFLEHLEDLRWTVVKMAIALLLAMIVCFAFRSTLVRVMQPPLHGLDPQIVPLTHPGITNSLQISFPL